MMADVRMSVSSPMSRYPKKVRPLFLSLVGGAVRSRSYSEELTDESAAVSPSIYGVAGYYREG